MSDSLAFFRQALGQDLSALAEQHYKHDLTQSDREALYSAGRTARLHTAIGSTLGLGLGLLLARRTRLTRRRLHTLFHTASQPTAVRFANGSEKPLPDLRAHLRPSRTGDFFTYLFLGLGGVFVGGEMGLLSGTFAARRMIGEDRGRRERVQRAFTGFQADALRAKAAVLDERRGAGIWK
ncbi:Hypothetical protein R9X50_00037000 [Acrodontium crateriforme]|uniref:Uncharacterized protein n=1 Tax=Acrodontium crateriforme TaxID=150365 RepID=A0AAQ3M066_9PEZI|nr:Hypothetical protein R9X50_00037000 [Acrodontium crateriforme]